MSCLSQPVVCLAISLATVLGVFNPLTQDVSAAELIGRVVDFHTGQPIAARVYVRNEAGDWLHVKSVEGQAVPYAKSRSAESTEVHTSVSAGAFRLDAPSGKYVVTVERGKEYLSHSESVQLGEETQELTIRLRRWIDMNALGWFSGETHVHRPLSDLPTAMLAEEMNVGLPLTHWVTRSHTPPAEGDRNAEDSAADRLIQLDDRHVIYPLNTEYEIFSVGSQRHTLGAVFAINHTQPLKLGAPPVTPIAQEVRRQGGLLELDKHNWPWSMMLPPVMRVDLYELTNNHIWRASFHYRDFGEAPAEYMRAERDPRGGVTEQGWIQFTLENYYALLNCGLPMKPTAGCASGVHPVPLGFGRVYVHLSDAFRYQDWIAGLGAGRSFVTTGPMMDVRFNALRPDRTIRLDAPGQVAIHGWIESPYPCHRIEILDAGEVVASITPQPQSTQTGTHRYSIRHKVEATSTTWLAVRCFSFTSERRLRFAHSAPMHVRVGQSKLKPRPEQIAYLLGRVEAELARNEGLLEKPALDEYRQAAEFYRQFLDQ